jgi:hypothetical protein
MTAGLGAAPEVSPSDREFFEAKIRPVLVEKCYACHSARSPRPKAGLRVDTPDGLLRGGLSGPAVVPGKPEESLLIQAIAHEEDMAPMPPKGRLPDSVVSAFRNWVKMGAPDPRDGGPSPTPSAATSAAPEPDDWWSLRPIVRPAVPSPAGDDRSPVDVFLAEGLRDKGLTPAPEADRRTLVRRVAFDLTGLPPTPEEVEAFVTDDRPDAYDRLVDRLLASPAYGERQARFWMDLVHFAETHGHDQDRIRPNAWPYRDYLIESFNRDTPYARFVCEQLAADVIYPDEPRLTVALGFIAAGPWDESSLRDIREDSIDRAIGHYLDRDDMVATAVSTFVSTTVHCARCHDHKFDPIPTADYYALQAVFAGVDRADRAYDPDPTVHRTRRELTDHLKALRRHDPQALAALRSPETVAETTAWRTALRATPSYLTRLNLDPTELAVTVATRSLERQLSALPPPKLVYAGASDFAPDHSHKPAGGPRPVHILRRGDIHHPIAPAAPGALSCVAGLDARFAIADPVDEGARRAALARWITDPRNPLTWRSIVNRVWQEHFGRGLVDTPNDFGRMGSTPTHPELLDWLAAEFRDGGGSLKRLHRLIVTTAAYRRSTRHDPGAAEVDAENRRLWRQNRRRLDAEAVRDAILSAAGRLDRTMGGPSVQQFGMKPGVHVTPVLDYTAFDWDGPGSGRRGVYRFLFRTLPDPFMDSLDAADASQLTAARGESATALQALALLNNAFILRNAGHLARRLERQPGGLDDRVRSAFALTLGRPPSDDELRDWSDFAGGHGLAAACRLLFNSNEFLFVN